ncbi:MAG: OmpA family protein [Maribacter sp.]
MKNFSRLLVAIAVLTSSSHFGQSEDIKFTSKDSIVQSSWVFGLGYNFVDDSGGGFDNLLAVKKQWNSLPYPNRISIGKYFKSGIGVEAIGTYNKYKAGKIVEKAINDSDKAYLAFDTRFSYDLNGLIGQTAWFDPYIGVGAGYTKANEISRVTYNGVIGFRTWFSDRFGLDFSSSGKWNLGNKASNHIQHSAGVVYQFGIEKELSKKGKEKLALQEALQKERERVNDSINSAREAAEAIALAKRLEEEKEKARLATIEQAKIDAEKSRKLALRNKIDKLGFVYFDLNSSYINKESERILNELVTVLSENSGLKLKVTSHTDSRGKSSYNKWLSEKRVKRTVDYLIANGIDSSSLEAEAFGEENLLNDCDDLKYCSEDEHQVNRRSEFIIIAF